MTTSDDVTFYERNALSITIAIIVVGMASVFASTAQSVLARLALALP